MESSFDLETSWSGNRKLLAGEAACPWLIIENHSYAAAPRLFRFMRVTVTLVLGFPGCNRIVLVNIKYVSHKDKVFHVTKYLICEHLYDLPRDTNLHFIKIYDNR